MKSLTINVFKLTLCVYLYHLSIESRTSISFPSLLSVNMFAMVDTGMCLHRYRAKNNVYCPHTSDEGACNTFQFHVNVPQCVFKN